MILFLTTHEQFYSADILKLEKFSQQLNLAHCIFPSNNSLSRWERLTVIDAELYKTHEEIIYHQNLWA